MANPRKSKRPGSADTSQSAAGLPRLKEIDVQLACVDFMRLDRWRPLRTDPCSDRSRGKGFGEESMADHLFIRYMAPVEVRYHAGAEKAAAAIGAVFRAPKGGAQVLWVEFKRPAGRDARGRMHSATSATPDQLLWHQLERSAGAMTAIAGVDFEPTYEAFVAWYRTSGLLERKGL